MRSAVALESRRVQASASLIMTSAMVSMPMICANGSAFSNRGGTASCFFLAGRSVEMCLDGLTEGGKQGLYGPRPPLSHPHQLFLFFSIWRKRLLVSCLHPHSLGWAFHSRSLPALAGPCRSPGGV